MWEGRLMKKFPYKTFASLCESYISEVSTSLNVVQQKPGGAEVIKFLHKERALAHDQSYRPVDKISWSELKDSYRGAWVIVVGSQAVGAIKSDGGTTGNYEAIALDPSTGELKRLKDSRGGNILDFLKPVLGKFVKYYVGKNSTAVQDKKRKRSELQANPSATVNQDTIIKKFKPLWVKAMTAAIADVKGMASTMIKNDAYDKAEKKINLLRKLQSAIESIEAGSEDIPDSIRTAVSGGIVMAAAHHYPEQTGEITRSRYSSGSYTPERHEGPQQLLNDIASGDTAKLGTILSFFKRSLMAT